MFFINLGYRWSVATAVVEEVQGAIALPTGNDSERLRRSSLPEFPRLLLDPQLYLLALDPTASSKVCARLATFPWFGVEDVPDFDSGASNRTDWMKAVRENVIDAWPSSVQELDIENSCLSSIVFQLEMSCTHIILPSPLIVEREDEAQTQGEWLDQGLAAAQALDVAQPILTTVAVSDTVINEGAFDVGGFFDAIADQVSAREGLEGVYLVVCQSRAAHPFESDAAVQRAYLWLSRAFSRAGYDTVLTNFADVLGVACLGVGANSFATGPTQGLRRLSLQAFDDEGGGRALPKLYSHGIVAEFLTETDLNPLQQARLIRKVAEATPYSEPLLEALAAGDSAASVISWAESQNNVAMAQKHFVSRLASVGREISGMTRRARGEGVASWLEDAVANGLYLKLRMEPNDVPGDVAPTDEWLELYEGIAN